MITRDFLIEMRGKALRRGVWFKSLDRVERGIFSLTAQVVERVESVVLGIELVKMLKKLRDALKSRFVRHVEEFGFRRAREIKDQAVNWGNYIATGWASDLDFVKYLTMMDLNHPRMFII